MEGDVEARRGVLRMAGRKYPARKMTVGKINQRHDLLNLRQVPGKLGE